MSKKAHITKVQRWDKVAKATLEIEGKSKDFMFWNNAPFSSAIVEGAEVEFRSESRENPKSQSPGKHDLWLVEVNGQSEKAPKGGGGGGYRPAPPKTREEIHASNLAGIAKSCAESMTVETKDKVKLFRELCAAYWDEVAKVAEA